MAPFDSEIQLEIRLAQNILLKNELTFIDYQMYIYQRSNGA